MISQDKGRLVFCFLFILFIDIRRRLAAGEQSQTSNVLTLNLGSTAKLECRIGETESKFKITWKSDEKTLFQHISNEVLIKKEGKFESVIKQDKSISWLHISNATFEDAGKYACFVEFYTAGKSRYHSWTMIVIQDPSRNDVIDPSRNDVIDTSKNDIRVASDYYNTTHELRGPLAAWSASPISTSTQVSPTSASQSNSQGTAILCVGLAIILALIITRFRKKHILFCRHRQQSFSVRDDANAVYTDMSQGVPEGYVHYRRDTAKLHDSVPELYCLGQDFALGNRDFNKAVQNDYREGPQSPRADLPVNSDNSDGVYENLHRTTKLFEIVTKPDEKTEEDGIEEEDEEVESDEEETYIQVTRLR